MRRPALALAVVCTLLPAAGSLQRAAAMPAAPHLAKPSAHRLSAASWLAQQRRAVRAAGGTIVNAPTAPSAGTYDLEQFASLVPAGVLKGSSQDVLDLRRTALPGQASSDGVTARVGATGKALWHLTLHQPAEGFVAVYPAVVGSPARRGIVVDTTSQTTQSGQTDFTETVAAYAGATGHRLWTDTFTGDQPVNGSTTTVPSYVGVQVQPHGGPSFLIAEESTAGSTDSSQLVDVNGSNGSFTELGDPVTSTGAFPTFTALPDVNHDGIGDIAVTVSGGSSPYVAGLSGASGQQLWLIKGANPLGVESIGHFSAAHDIDLALSFETSSGSLKIVVFDATARKVIWIRTAGELNVIDKAGAHLQKAVQLVTFSSKTTSKKVTADAKFLAVSSSNKVLYDKTVSVSEAPLSPKAGSETDGSAGVVGDVQGDGSLEDLLNLSASSVSATKTRTTTRIGIVDGRTGLFRELNADIAADGSLHKGSHTDFLAVRVTSGKPELSAWRGSTRTPYYLDQVVSGVTEMRSAWIAAGRVSGHSCSDVLLSAASANAGFIGVVDGAGQPLWLVKHTAKQATGGTIVHVKKPTDYCA